MCQIRIWSMLDILVQILVMLQFPPKIIVLSSIIIKLFLRVIPAINYLSKRFKMILIHYHRFFYKYDVLRLHIRMISSSSFTSPLRMDSYPKECTKWCAIARTVFPGVNPLIIQITIDFISGCIDLYLYLAHARSNDHYCCSILGLFLPVSASTLTIFEDFS